MWIYSTCAFARRGWQRANHGLSSFMEARILPRIETSSDGGGALPQSLRHTEELAPEHSLVAAILRQVLIDIGQKRPTSKKSGGWISLAEQLQAIEWVYDLEAIAFWSDLIGIDARWLQEQLAVEAGLDDSTPRLGERYAPGPPNNHHDTQRNLHA